MKVLVITHGNNSLYGAATSLKLLLQNCQWEFDIVYSRHVKYHTTREEMLAYTGNKAGQAFCIFLPFVEKCISSSVRFYNRIRYFLFRILIFFDHFKLQKIIKKGSYDYILLNSLVLYPLINKRNKFVCYIREMCTAQGMLKKNMIKKLEQAEKLIFIDPSLTEPLEEVSTVRLVINNPFDMKRAGQISLDRARMQFPQIDHGKIVITMAGMILPVKGVSFVIDVFKKMKRKDLILAIAGAGMNKTYIEECHKKADSCNNICFLGEQKDMDFVYRVSDYIIRAEEYFVTGRTVYEGLYAGCGLIVQSKKEDDKNKMQEYERFQDRIYFYQARNEDSLIKIFETLPEEKRMTRVFLSNTEEYAKKVTAFLED